jgi:phosphoenolpyruvate phosphomutase
MLSDTAGAFRRRLVERQVSFLMQVHDGISTKVAQRSGFGGLWASSFACSAALGLPDDDSMTMQEVLQYLRPIIRCSEIPVLVDGNCGFSSRQETRIFVESLIHLGAAAVCFEDKRYPKENTFYAPLHPLRSADDYCELLRAACDARYERELVIVARTEALVVGEPIDDVVTRCETYCAAGAEGVFIAFADDDTTRLRSFIDGWNGRAPLLLNPTAYLRSLPSLVSLPGVSIVVWANHNIRACVKAMSSICNTLSHIESTIPDLATRVNNDMSSMADIFDLIGYARKS